MNVTITGLPRKDESEMGAPCWSVSWKSGARLACRPGRHCRDRPGSRSLDRRWRARPSQDRERHTRGHDPEHERT
jgi:hypothetical protein